MVDSPLQTEQTFTDTTRRVTGKKKMKTIYKEKCGEIICGDCVEVMKKFPDNIIDLTVTSPPYDNLRAYKGYVFNFEEIANQLYRITKQGGVVAWIVGDSTIKGSETGNSFRQALYFKGIGFNLHDTMIYVKRNYMPKTHNRYEQQFEYMFVLSKGKPRVFNALMKENISRGQIQKGTYRHNGSNLEIIHKYGQKIKEEGIRTNVWFYSVNVPRIGSDNHPAVFPEKLAEDHILSWSNKGDLVLDPMCGSGTTCGMAKSNDRKYMGIDICEEYCGVAKKRLESIER